MDVWRARGRPTLLINPDPRNTTRRRLETGRLLIGCAFAEAPCITDAVFAARSDFRSAPPPRRQGLLVLPVPIYRRGKRDGERGLPSRSGDREGKLAEHFDIANSGSRMHRRSGPACGTHCSARRIPGHLIFVRWAPWTIRIARRRDDLDPQAPSWAASTGSAPAGRSAGAVGS